MITKPKTSRQDLLIYKAFRKAVELDKLRIYLDYSKINRPSSPVYDPWESLLPILVPVLLGLLLILCVGIFFGLLFIIAMVFAYTAYFKRKLHKRLIFRTKNFLTANIDNCQKLWDFGGIVFVNTENKQVGCVSPEGDWKEFVVANYNEFMTEKKEPQKEEKTRKHDKPLRRKR